MPKYELKNVHISSYDIGGSASSDAFDFGTTAQETTTAGDAVPVENVTMTYEKIDSKPSDDGFDLAVPQEQQTGKYTGFQTIEIKRPPEPPKDHTSAHDSEEQEFDFSGLSEDAQAGPKEWIPIETIGHVPTHPKPQAEPTGAFHHDNWADNTDGSAPPAADDFLM